MRIVLNEFPIIQLYIDHKNHHFRINSDNVWRENDVENGKEVDNRLQTIQEDEEIDILAKNSLTELESITS